MTTLRRNITRTVLLLLLLPAAAFLNAQKPDSPAVAQLLEKVKGHAALADNDAAALASFLRSGLSWQSHGVQLESIKFHVNNLVKDTAEMSELRHEGSPWQQQAIDRISPLLPEIASHLTATIQHFNENLNQTRMKPYRELVLNNEKLIHNAHEIIADFVDYGEAKNKAEALERELEPPPSKAPGI